MVVRGAQANDATNGCNTTTTVPGAQRYFVRVIDTSTIQLTTTLAAAVAASDATITATPGTPGTAGDPTPLTLSSTAGIAVGTQLIYRAPVNTQATFPSAVVNVTLEDRDVDGTIIRFPAAGHDQAAENVYVGADCLHRTEHRRRRPLHARSRSVDRPDVGDDLLRH